MNTDLATQTDTGLPASYGNVTPDLIAKPKPAYAELLQGLSGKIKPESGFTGLQQGMRVHSKTGVVLADTMIVLASRIHWIEEKVLPGDKYKTVVFETSDKNDPRVQTETRWIKIEGGEDLPPVIEPVLTIMALFGDDKVQLPIVLKGTNYKPGTELLRVCMNKGEELYKVQFKVGSTLYKNNVSYIWTFDRIGPTPEAILKVAIDLTEKANEEENV